MATKTLPGIAYLHTVLRYDPKAGVLIWKISNPRYYGKVAGTPLVTGHVQIGLDHVPYYAHRIIWKMMTGDDPKSEIDHKDTDPGNNRWLNLRRATHGQNTSNKGVRADSRTGLKGVTPHKSGFISQIRYRGKNHYLGLFKTPEAAHAAYCEAAAKLHGAFARGR